MTKLLLSIHRNRSISSWFGIYHLPVIGLILFACLNSCQTLPDAQEIKHPSLFLKGKTKIVKSKHDTTFVLVLEVKNKARKTSYQNIEVMLQLLNSRGDSICIINYGFTSSGLKPHRKKTFTKPINCPPHEPAKALIIDLYGTPVKKLIKSARIKQTPPA